MRSLALFILLALVPMRLQAATITVDSTSSGFSNDGNCTLHEAVQAANTNVAVDQCAAGSGPDRIEFAAATDGGTITLGAAASGSPRAWRSSATQRG